MTRWYLSDIAQAVDGVILTADTAFEGVSIDSRTIKSGELFIALQGDNFDEDKWKTFKKYIIGSGAKAGTDLAGHTGDYFLCPYGEIIKEGADADNPEGTSWSYQWLVTESDTGRIHDDPAGKLWKIGFGTGVVTELPSETFIPSTWDTFFAVSVMDKKDTNIIKQCYQYLKSLSAFDDATDL